MVIVTVVFKTSPVVLIKIGLEVKVVILVVSFITLEPFDCLIVIELTLSHDLPKIANFITDGQIYFTGRKLMVKKTPYTGWIQRLILEERQNAQGMIINSPGTKFM
jgi:hypothetical protein